MSGAGGKLDARMDAWLKEWPAPERSEEAWEDASLRVADQLASLTPGQGDDSWFAAPLPAEPGEGGTEPVKQAASEVRMSDPGADNTKRKSLKDIAQRVSNVPAPPASTPSPEAPPPSAATRSNASAQEFARPSVMSRPSEARDSDSGILDLAAVRASQASLPDSGAEAGTAGLFDDEAPQAAAPVAAVPKAQPVKKSSNLIPLFGGGIVAIAAIAAAFFVVVKGRAPHADALSETAPPAAAVAASAAPAEGALPAATATASGLSAEALAMATAPPPPGAAEPGAGRSATGAEPAKGAAKADDTKGDKSTDTKKEPAGPSPTDLGGAMATAVGASTATPGAGDKKDEPAGGPPSGSIPEAPSQGAIQGAVGSVMGGAKACVAGMDEPSRANIVFGSNGRVKSVSVSGPAASTGAAGCIKSALSKASVGPFQRDSYSVGVTIRP